MIDKTVKKSTLTTIGIDQRTNKLIDKLCKRYSLKKGEIVKLAFLYMDKACINPAEAPESTKTELSRINKRQDDIIRFIRNYEEKELNPMIRVVNGIAVRFKDYIETLDKIIDDKISITQLQTDKILKMFDDDVSKMINRINLHTDSINNQDKTIKRQTSQILEVMKLQAELSACGITDSKKKESLKNEINKVIAEISR